MEDKKKVSLEEFKKQQEAKMNAPVSAKEFYDFVKQFGEFINELKYDFITLYLVLIEKGIINEEEMAKKKKELKEKKNNPPLTIGQIVAKEIPLEDKIRLAKENGLESEIENIKKYHELQKEGKENNEN